MQAKRGQIEVMGLLLIIVLFAFGVLIALYFVLTPSNTSASQQIKDSIVAGNTLTTLRKTSTDCYGRTIEQLLDDCARTGGSLACPQGPDTCQVADTTMNEILDATFKELQRDYYFTISGATYFDNVHYGTPCPGAQESKTEPIPVGVGYDITLTLNICS